MEILQGEVTTAFLRDFKPGREQCWVAERAGLMAGAVMLVDAGGDVGQLRLLHVEPWARGLGIGSALVGECVSFARAAGYDAMRLWTHTILTSARRIYEAAGFRIVETAVHDEFGEPVQGETWELALAGVSGAARSVAGPRRRSALSREPLRCAAGRLRRDAGATMLQEIGALRSPPAHRSSPRADVSAR